MTGAMGVALITGGGTGVGAATAELLARRGWSVAINYSRSADAAKSTAEICRRHGVRSIVLQGDVSKDEDCRRVVAATVEQFGGIDLLVNSAGTMQVTKFSDLALQNADEIQRVYGVNVIGPYQMGRAAQPYLAASGRGAIVNISSISGETGSGSSIAYVLSKGALNTLTVAFSRLFAPSIRVNAVVPGMIDTEWFTGNGVETETFAGMRQRFLEASALGRISSAQEIAGAVVYVGVDATAMTGQSLTIDAGFLLGKPPLPSK